MTVAFLREYNTLDSIVDTLGAFSTQLDGNNSQVTAQLPPLYAEAEKSATGLLWPMSTMIR